MSVSMPLPHKISQSVQGQYKFRTLVMKFGNGYEQVKNDGINNLVTEWQISWNSLLLSERNTVVNALILARGADVLLWTPPGFSSDQKFRMTEEGFTQTYRAGEVFSISTNIYQVF